jgi:hypothetical protein
MAVRFSDPRGAQQPFGLGLVIVRSETTRQFPRPVIARTTRRGNPLGASGINPHDKSVSFFLLSFGRTDQYNAGHFVRINNRFFMGF